MPSTTFKVLMRSETENTIELAIDPVSPHPPSVLHAFNIILKADRKSVVDHAFLSGFQPGQRILITLSDAEK